VEGERVLLLLLLSLLEVDFSWIRDEVASNESKLLTDWLLDCGLQRLFDDGACAIAHGRSLRCPLLKDHRTLAQLFTRGLHQTAST
jgi:hypothetical protein